MCPLSCPEVESGSELEVLWERLYSMDKVKLFLDPRAGGGEVSMVGSYQGPVFVCYVELNGCWDVDDDLNIHHHNVFFYSVA